MPGIHFDCDKLLHPFQNDPGTSQRARVMDALLGGPAKIDGRSLADLLQFFVKLAPNIVYYDKDLQAATWTPFFQKSLPFLLAGMTDFTSATIDSKIALYNRLFKKKPSGSGLQLNLFYTYYNLIRQLNTWSCQLAGSQLPIEATINKLIKTKLKQPLLQFIGIANAAAKWFGVKKVDFGPLVMNPAWGLDLTDLYAMDTAFKSVGPGRRKRIMALQREAEALVPDFAAALGILAAEAPGNIQQSFLPLAADLQQKHQPHLALIFVFLQLFLQLQNDINGFKKKHLDYFYTNVLQLKPQPAVGDKANLIVALQNQVQSFLLDKGRVIKDGKDNNKADILFALDEAIAVNLTQATDIRTLFCNNKTAYDKTWTEGVYMAPNATMADGIKIAFTADPKNYPTLGAEYSKYVPPGGTGPQLYPGARIGFLLASNVLLLNEGTRHVRIHLSCKIDDNPCGTAEDYPTFIDKNALYPYVAEKLQHSYVEITEALVQQAQQQGVDPSICDDIKKKYLIDHCHRSLCGSSVTHYKDSHVIRWHHWQHWLTVTEGYPASVITILDQLFIRIYPFNVNFSGAKGWIAPEKLDIDVSPPTLGGGNSFDIWIHARLGPDQPAVTLYSVKALGEDFNTTEPVVKVELNDKIKVDLDDAGIQSDLSLMASGPHCCLDIKPNFCGAKISLYQFFRFVNIGNTHIHVKVCGLKNFIVQNDDSLQNVNSPILPFGARPTVGASFYIGCEEIFLKHWEDIYINLDWKDFPPDPPAIPPPGVDGPMSYYYLGYQDVFSSGITDNLVDDKKFQMVLSVLQDGQWVPWNHGLQCKLVNPPDPQSMLFSLRTGPAFCLDDVPYKWQYTISRNSDFLPALPDPTEKFGYLGLKRLDVSTRQSFIRITMSCQDFQHDRYPFVLARQMNALGKLPDFVDGAVYYGITGPGQYQVIDIKQLFADVLYASQLANDTPLNTPPLSGIPGGLVDAINAALVTWGLSPQALPDATAAINSIIAAYTKPINAPSGPNFPGGMDNALDKIFSILGSYEQGILNSSVSKGVYIPKQPWTPTIDSISLDYEARAHANANQVSLIHLYPFTGTYEPMQIRLQPPLFPRLCDEGTLFVGLSGLVPGTNVNFLFQLAEATADSESSAAKVFYSYLARNQWNPLREGFEVVDDGTEGLTRTGILKLSLPANMTNTNTVMPNGLFWIKAAVAQNVEGVSETSTIKTQAISATFINSKANDQLRMAKPLAAGSLSRLADADSHIKTIDQPYASFGGALPEAQGNFYLRVSELLHHKDRAIQKFDYERLVLQQFPVVYKAKCISHSLALDGEKYKNDFPIAPGYVLLAVIPDLNRLAAGNSMQPKLPVSILEDIYTYLSGLISPFVRLRAMNPRYEKINLCIHVRLMQGMDQQFFQQQLAIDVAQFLAPWAVGQYDKLGFGQPVYRSDVIAFIEGLPYIDFIVRLEMFSEFETALPLHPHLVIYGKTPRSILIGGDIEVKALLPRCDSWDDDQKHRCPPTAVNVRPCDPVEKQEEMV